MTIDSEDSAKSTKYNENIIYKLKLNIYVSCELLPVLIKPGLMGIHSDPVHYTIKLKAPENIL